MLSGVFHLHEQEARQVMTPIPAVITVDISQDVETALKLCISSGHTRLVVIEEENRDRVRGLVHASTLAQRMMEDGPQASVEPIVHDAPIVPETKPLDDLLADLQRQRTSMAVVVDEYGRVVGIVTIEDIIEEVVGEIVDETDPMAGEVRRLAEGECSCAATSSIADLPTTGWSCPSTATPTTRSVASCSPSWGACPAAATRSRADGFSIRVESVHHNRIEAVRIRQRRPVPSREARDGRGALSRRLRHVRPAGGAGRSVCTGRRRLCVANCVASTSISTLMKPT